MRSVLTLDQIETFLSRNPGWRREGAELVKTFRFGAYLSGIDFVNLLAQSAERMDHHPDMEVGWCKVTVRLTTHSAAGITSLDLKMAEEAEEWSRTSDETAQVGADAKESSDG